MTYISLLKVYRKSGSNLEVLNEAYEHIFMAPYTRQLNFSIKQQGRNNIWQVFYCYTEEMLGLITSIFKHTLDLKLTKTRLTKIGLKSFAFSNMVEEIMATNMIEGVNSSRKDISLAMDKQKNKKSRDIRFWYVVNKYKRITKQENIAFNTPSDIRRFYDEFILTEVIKEDPNNAPDGKIFRKDAVSVGNGHIGQETHIGVYPEDKIIVAMEEALDILHNAKLNNLIRIAVFHYLFAYIHPFYDGNGRVDRFISSYYLSKELDELIGLKLSFTIKNNVKSYYKLFQTTNDDFNRGDLTPFILGFLKLIEEDARIQKENLEESCCMLEKGYEHIKTTYGGDELLCTICFILLQSTLFSVNGVTFNDILQTCRKSRNTIQDRLREIPMEMLEVRKEGKEKRYKLAKQVVEEWIN